MTRGKNIVIFLFAVVLIITVIWVVQLLGGNQPLTDQATRDIALWLEGSILFNLFEIVTHLGSGFFLYPFVITLTILLFVWYRDWMPAVFFGGGVLLSHFLNQGIKHVITRERPSISVSLNAEGYSFPSGHAMISMVCYGLLAYFISRKLKERSAIVAVQIFFSVLILLIGISRYVINVHYLTDVLAGFFFGFLLLTGLIFLYERWKGKRSPS